MKPGHNALGEWLSDDDAGVQAMAALAAGLRALGDAVEIIGGFSSTAMAAVAESRRQLDAVEQILPMIDVGTKPGKERR